MKRTFAEKLLELANLILAGLFIGFFFEELKASVYSMIIAGLLVSTCLYILAFILLNKRTRIN